jgi:ketosteroid isomerase-like protein
MDASTPAQQQSIEVEQHLRQLDDEWVKALVRGDGEALERIMADDFLFAYPLEGDDKAQFIADLTSGEMKMEHLSREQVRVRVFGNTAVLTGRDSATWLFHGREVSGQYKVIKVYSLRGGRWQLCVVQACPMIQPDAHVPSR